MTKSEKGLLFILICALQKKESIFLDSTGWGKRSGELSTTLAIFSLIVMGLGMFVGNKAVKTTQQLRGQAQTGVCPYSAINEIRDNETGQVLTNVSGFSWRNSFNESGRFPGSGQGPNLRNVWNESDLGNPKYHDRFMGAIRSGGYAEASVTLIYPPDYEIVSGFVENYHCDGDMANTCTPLPSFSSNKATIERIRITCDGSITYGWKVQKNDTVRPGTIMPPRFTSPSPTVLRQTPTPTETIRAGTIMPPRFTTPTPSPTPTTRPRATPTTRPSPTPTPAALRCNDFCDPGDDRCPVNTICLKPSNSAAFVCRNPINPNSIFCIGAVPTATTTPTPTEIIRAGTIIPPRFTTPTPIPEERCFFRARAELIHCNEGSGICNPNNPRSTFVTNFDNQRSYFVSAPIPPERIKPPGGSLITHSFNEQGFPGAGLPGTAIFQADYKSQIPWYLIGETIPLTFNLDANSDGFTDYGWKKISTYCIDHGRTKGCQRFTGAMTAEIKVGCDVDLEFGLVLSKNKPVITPSPTTPPVPPAVESCKSDVESGGSGAKVREWDMGITEGKFLVNYSDVDPDRDRLEIFYEDKLIFSTVGRGTSSEGTNIPVEFGPGTSTKVKAVATGGRGIWFYGLSCPRVPYSGPTCQDPLGSISGQMLFDDPLFPLPGECFGQPGCELIVAACRRSNNPIYPPGFNLCEVEFARTTVKSPDFRFTLNNIPTNEDVTIHFEGVKPVGQDKYIAGLGPQAINCFEPRWWDSSNAKCVFRIENERSCAITNADYKFWVSKFSTQSDMNSDGEINSIDYSMVLKALDTSGENLRADINRDGAVNALDLSIIIQYLGRTAK